MFVKVTAEHRPRRSDSVRKQAVVYLALDWIEEVQRGVPIYKVEDGKVVLDNEGNQVIETETTVIYVAGSDNHGAFESRYYVKEEVSKVIDRIEAARVAGRHCCDPETDEDGDVLQLNDRGVWLPGESYVQLDVVKHPEDVSKRYVALQASKSTSVLVLANTGYWCEVR